VSVDILQWLLQSESHVADRW